MVDITKEELWGNNDDGILKKEKKFIGFKKIIEKYRFIIILISILGVLMLLNLFLIYNFLKMFVMY